MRHPVTLFTICLLFAALAPAWGEGVQRRAAEPLVSDPDARFLPGVPGLHLGPKEFPDRIRGVDEALIIQMTYRALATALGRSGYEVKFALDDFRTRYRKDFGHILLSDLVSVLPTTLEIEYTEVSGGDETGIDLLGAAYEPAWRVEDESFADPTASMAGYTYDAILRLAASDPESAADDPQDVVAVTSYRVEAHYAEESVAYRAMFVWLADADGTVRFLPQDYVTERVDEIWDLSQRSAPLDSLLRNVPAEPAVERGSVR